MRNSSSRSLRICSSSAFSISCARWSFSTPSRVNTCTSITVPSCPGGTRSEVSFTSDAFSPKIARSSFSSGVSWVSPFGVTLPTRMSPGVDFGADVDDARFVELRSAASPTFGMSRGDFLRSELRVARDTGQFLDVDGREAVLLDDALGDQDRVFEVVAVPRHERDAHVLAERELAQVVRRTVGQRRRRARSHRLLAPADAG